MFEILLSKFNGYLLFDYRALLITIILTNFLLDKKNLYIVQTTELSFL